MTKHKFCCGACAILFLLLAIPSLAHHGFTVQYDGTNCSNIKGTLAKIEWVNPHPYFYVDAKSASGAVDSWTFETVSIGWLKRNGTTKDDFTDNIGKAVTVRACMAKSGVKHRGAAETVKLQNGRTLEVGMNYER